MGKSLLLVFSSLILSIQQLTNIDLNLATESEYNINIVVKNVNHYNLAGMLVTINYNGNKIINGELTNGQGQVIKQGKWPTSQQQSITIQVNTQFDETQNNQDCQGIMQNNVLNFNCQIIFSNSDVLTSDSLQISQISFTTYQVGTKQTLKGAEIDITIVYYINKQEKQIKFNGKSDDKGQEIIHFWLPKVQAAILLYDTHQNGYWNSFQKDQNNQKFYLNAQNKYQLTFDVEMLSGNLDYIISGLVVDEKTTKPIQGVKVKIDGKNLITSELINPMNMLTTADGKFTVKYTLPVFEKFQLNWSIEKDKYMSQQNTLNIQIDLDKKVDSYSKDLGTIKLQQSLGTMIVSGLITDASKVQTIIEGAQISIQMGPNTMPETTTSDKQGKYTLTFHTPVDEKLTFIANVKAKGFLDTKSDPQTVTVSLSKPSQVSLNIPMNRITLPITISEIVINASDKKPVPDTTVKIISSVPEIIGSKFYNQNIVDKADGSVQLKFECYETIKFTVTIEYSVPLYVPYVITSNQLDCKDQNLGSTQITLSKQTATMTLKGEAKDIESKPMKGLSLTFSSDPQIQVANPKLSTDNNGLWSLTGLTIIPKTSYQLKMTYENALKEAITIPFKYEATMEKTQTVQFPAIFYQSLIKGSVSGTISTPQGKVNLAIPITVTCNTKGKDGKPLVIQSKTNVDGTYKVDLECLGESDKSIDCTVTSGSNPSVQPFTGKVSVSSPKWAGESQISATYNSIDITIKGLVSDASKIVKQIEGANIVLTLTPNDVLIPTGGGKQKLHELEQFMNSFKKHHKGQEQTSILNTKSGKDGSYSFTFKQIAGMKLSGDISASMELFNAYSKKGIILDGSKTQTITEDILMDRSRLTIKLHSTLLSQDKKAIPGAEIAISKSDPMVLNSKSYNVAVKDDDKGAFVLNFECYKDQEYISTLKINIPSYVEQNTNTPKYKCTNSDTQLAPIEIKLEKITVMAIFSGKIINPYGKGQNNLALSFSTKPDSTTLSTTTSADGVWTINDPKISPNEEYVGTISYKDIEKKDEKIDQKFKIQTANQKITFPDIHYSDFVNAKITGTVTVDKGTITQPITINLSCTPTKSNTKPINIDFKSDNKGQFTQSFQVIGNYAEPLHCTLTTQNGVDQVTQKIDIQQPTYEANNVQIKSKLTATKLTLTGKLTDQTKLTDKIPNIIITLALTPADPLATILTTKSQSDSQYTLEIEIVKGNTYQAIFTADGTPSFEISKQNFQIIASQDKMSIVKDFILQRTIIDCTIQASLAGTWNPEANVEITKSIPQMSDNSIYNKPVLTQSGAFKFPFKCYNNIQTTLEMDMWSQVYPKTILPPQEFDCGPKIVNLKPITVSSKSVQITLSGIITDLTGIAQSVGDAKIEIELTPKDPLATMLSTKSDYNGKYSQIFGAVQGQTYSAIIKVTSDDFIPYTSKPFTIDASKTQEIKQNAALDRVVIKASVTSTLLDPQGKPVPQAKISNEELTPMAKGHEKDPITGETDGNGKFKLTVSCYKNVKETIVLNINKAEYDPYKTDKQTFICNADTTITPIKGNLVKTPTKTKLTIKGSLLDPQGKGKGGIPIKYSSEPITNTQEVKTTSDGKWQIIADQLLLNIPYTLKFTHVDGDGTTQTTSQSFQTKDLQSNLDVAPIYYSDYETINIDGKLSTSSGLTASSITVNLNSQNIGKDKKPISLQTQTDNNGKYNFKFDILAKFKAPIKLNLNTVANPKFKSTSFQLDLLPPQFSISKETTIEPTQEYLDQINKYYQEIGITGQIVGQFKCNDKISILPIPGVDISLQQWNGLEYKDMNVQAKTDVNGIFLIITSIYKSQIQNEINVQISKTQYLPKQIMFNPFIYQTDLGQKIIIDLQTNELTYLGDGAPCPSKLI